MAKKGDIFYSDRVEGGHFVTRPVLALLRELEGQQVEVCIRRRRKYTSIPQRGYYFGVVIWLIVERLRDHGVTGPHGGPITDQQVHEMLRAKFLREDVLVNPATGEFETIILSTTNLPAARMAEYVDQVRSWADQVLDLHIPDPDPSWSMVGRGE